MRTAYVMAPVLWLLSTMGVAMDQNALVVLAGQYSMLSADIGMIGYDPENIEYLDQATATYETVADGMDQWLDQLPAEKRASADQEWKSFQAILEGESGYPGLLEGYDLNLDASQRIHYDALQTILQQSEQLSDASLSELQTLYLKLSSAVAGYVSLTSNPFGSMAMSMNDADLKLVTLASEIDMLFSSLLKGNGDQMLKDQLRRQQSKWQFVRSTIIKASQSAMPYIVRYQGRQMINDIAALMPSTES